MQKTMKRTLALILAVVLCFSAMPFSAFAVEMTPDETLSSHAPSSEAPAESSQPEPSAAPETGPESSAAPEESAVTSTGSSPAPSTEPTAEPAADPTPEPATGSDDSGLTPGTELDMNRVWPALRRAQARAAGKFGTDGTLYVGDYCFPGGVGTPPTLGEYIGPMPIETMRYGSNNVAAFCIEHEKESGSGIDDDSDGPGWGQWQPTQSDYIKVNQFLYNYISYYAPEQEPEEKQDMGGQNM